MKRKAGMYIVLCLFSSFILFVNAIQCPQQPCVEVKVAVPLGPDNGRKSCSGMFCCFGKTVVGKFQDPFAEHYPDWQLGSFLYGTKDIFSYM